MFKLLPRHIGLIAILLGALAASGCDDELGTDGDQTAVTDGGTTADGAASSSGGADTASSSSSGGTDAGSSSSSGGSDTQTSDAGSSSGGTDAGSSSSSGGTKAETWTIFIYGHADHNLSPSLVADMAEANKAKFGKHIKVFVMADWDASATMNDAGDKYPAGNTGQWRGGEHYRLFACDRPTPADIAAIRAAQPTPKKGRRAKPKEPVAKPNRWNVELPFHVRAMVVAKDTIFIAGPPELVKTVGAEEEALLLESPEQPVAAWQGAKGGYLWAVSTKDAKRLSECKLEAPAVFDGLAATDGRLYMAMTDGSVICHGE